MKKIIFATGNQDKMREIREILADLDAEIFSLKDLGIKADIVEDGSTFEENAAIKAKAICEGAEGCCLGCHLRCPCRQRCHPRDNQKG